MSDFDEKYARALDELAANGLIYRGNWCLDALNWPFFAFQRTLRLKPIFYASLAEQWMRSTGFLFFILLLPVAFRIGTGGTVDFGARFAAVVVPVVFVSLFGTTYLRWQAKRKQLSAWSDF